MTVEEKVICGFRACVTEDTRWIERDVPGNQIDLHFETFLESHPHANPMFVDPSFEPHHFRPRVGKRSWTNSKTCFQIKNTVVRARPDDLVFKINSWRSRAAMSWTIPLDGLWSPKQGTRVCWK
eukprot:TRINITY_DN10845_c0_g3_i1.p1 TRINITY_DN10845_c0_g3~~TRINITY_DN10845_c0_g3_i1.p1  ORF type:complete len:124 (-),score=20.97 TRINITY_DN10845_c0_g3_i1:512-883(-)